MGKKTKKGYPTWDDVKRVQKEKKFRRLKRSYKKTRIYIFLFLISLDFVLIVPYNFELDNARYILSSIAQGLASLLALLFVIIFFLCQTLKRISVLSQILNPEGYILLFSFITSVIFPLIVLNMNVYGIWIPISIALALFCLLSLIPFTNRVNVIFRIFGISNAIFELRKLEFPRDNIRYMELIDDLMRVGTKDIVKLEPRFVINSFIEFIEDNIFSTKIMDYLKGPLINLLTGIAVYSTFLKEGRRYHYERIINIFFVLIWAVDRDDYLNLGLSSLSEMLSKLKMEKALTEEISLENTKALINSLFKLFIKTNIRNESVYEERKKKVEDVFLVFLRREIFTEDIVEKGLREHWNVTNKETSNKWKKPFGKYIKKLTKSAFEKESVSTALDFEM